MEQKRENWGDFCAFLYRVTTTCSVWVSRITGFVSAHHNMLCLGHHEGVQQSLKLGYFDVPSEELVL